MFGSLQQLASWLRHASDRWMHSRRHRRAMERVALSRPRSILFICHGNICRSPYAEAALRARTAADSELVIGSAGFLETGRRSPDAALRVAGVRSLDLEAHRSSTLTPRSVAAYELLVVMEPRQERWLLRLYPSARGRVLVLADLDPRPIRKRTILDPIGRTEAVFEQVYDRIDRCLEVLAAALAPEAEVSGGQPREPLERRRRPTEGPTGSRQGPGA